jgi:hypothetical protein
LSCQSKGRVQQAIGLHFLCLNRGVHSNLSPVEPVAGSPPDLSPKLIRMVVSQEREREPFSGLVGLRYLPPGGAFWLSDRTRPL